MRMRYHNRILSVSSVDLYESRNELVFVVTEYKQYAKGLTVQQYVLEGPLTSLGKMQRMMLEAGYIDLNDWLECCNLHKHCL